MVHYSRRACGWDYGGADLQNVDPSNNAVFEHKRRRPGLAANVASMGCCVGMRLEMSLAASFLSEPRVIFHWSRLIKDLIKDQHLHGHERNGLYTVFRDGIGTDPRIQSHRTGTWSKSRTRRGEEHGWPSNTRRLRPLGRQSFWYPTQCDWQGGSTDWIG